jgi:uncharacterized membrane protein YozB (DUF420 family)
MSFSDLPGLNACLNATSALLLILGIAFIRQGRKEAHRNSMLGALASSSLFLVSYLVYHAFAGRTVFPEAHWFRPIYLIILLTHTVLAVAIVPMVLATVWLAWRQRFEMHRKLARWTWPVWMYVSVTGVLIYLLLYRIFPQH